MPNVASVPGHGIPSGTHWVDGTESDTIVLVDQPEGQKCAVIGGIMASRMKVRGVKAVLVNGRIRDLAELRSCGLPVSLNCVLFQLIELKIPLALLALKFGNSLCSHGVVCRYGLEQHRQLVQAPSRSQGFATFLSMSVE